jgi:hypothetical protein
MINPLHGNPSEVEHDKRIPRHTPGCSKKTDPYGRRCNGRKSLYIYEDVKVRIQSAKTRTWERAEQLAQTERNLRNPNKRIAEQRNALVREMDAQAVLKKAKNITIQSACDRWVASQELPPPATATD